MSGKNNENPGELKAEKHLADYTIRIYYLPKTFQETLEILHRSNRVFYLQGYRFFFSDDEGLPENCVSCNDGTDITGDGSPNMIIYEWSGGAHCCHRSLIFEMSADFKLIATIAGEHSHPCFKDFEEDGKYEIIVNDWTYQYWPGSFADSPAPEVILHWNGHEYVVAYDLMKRPAPYHNELIQKANDISQSPEWSVQYNRLNVPRALLDYALDLMYSGHEDLGWTFIKMAWSPKFPLDSVLMEELLDRMNASPYWQQIKRQLK
jgi:hypothetical protein